MIENDNNGRVFDVLIKLGLKSLASWLYWSLSLSLSLLGHSHKYWSSAFPVKTNITLQFPRFSTLHVSCAFLPDVTVRLLTPAENVGKGLTSAQTMSSGSGQVGSNNKTRLKNWLILLGHLKIFSTTNYPSLYPLAFLYSNSLKISNQQITI